MAFVLPSSTFKRGYTASSTFADPKYSWSYPVTSRAKVASCRSKSSRYSSSQALDELSEERKANLFQFLLRDLQVEGVPLLAVDANQVAGFQAALWTTLAELYETMRSQNSDNNDEGADIAPQRVCLIFEEVPISALRTLVDDVMMIKLDQRLMQYVPELSRFSLSLVGKGVGPAILIDASDAEDSTKNPKETAAMEFTAEDEARCTAAMKIFVDRMVEDISVEVFPAAIKERQKKLPLRYRTCSFVDACHIMSSFWNAVCQVMAMPSPTGDENNAGAATLLLLPQLDDNESSEENYDRFVALSELMSRSLCLFQKSDDPDSDVLDLFHFHPSYNREKVYLSNQPAHGHIPPLSWTEQCAKEAGLNFDEETLLLCNYERRSPVPAVCIQRVGPLTGPRTDDTTELNLDGGTNMQVTSSALMQSVKNVERLATIGEETLNMKLTEERAIMKR